MRLKLRVINEGVSEVEVELSKSSSVSELLAHASDLLEVHPDRLELFYNGTALTLTHPLLFYKFKDDDMILVRVKQLLKVEDDSAKNDEITKVNADSECISKFFEVGDKIYYQNEENGQWREASVVSITKGDEESSDDENLLYTVHDGESVQDLQLRLECLRPCSAQELNAEQLEAGMVILCFVVLSDDNSGWYTTEVTKVVQRRGSHPKVYGRVTTTTGLVQPEQEIKFLHRTLVPSKLLPRDEWLNMSCWQSLAKPCSHCFDHPTKKCKECSCRVCGGKEDEDKQVICDECEETFHMGCLNPPLKSIPEDEWFCGDCLHVDQNLAKKYKAQAEAKVQKIKKSTDKVKEGKRDWGKGLSTAAVTDKFSVVPTEHLGKIPGVPSGRLWASRLDVSRFGVHRPPVAGICGAVNRGVESVCFSGGYAGDYDDGTVFVMSGSGGRDLSQNKRVNKQSSAQTLSGGNLALAQSCHAIVNGKEGARATDWRLGLPIRVVRGFKLAKISKFAPKVGYRYDGLYKVARYFKEEVEGNLMWKFELRRDDPEPAPWTSAGMAFMKSMSVGFLEGTTTQAASKRKLNEEPGPSKKAKTAYVLPAGVASLAKEDTLNQKHWEQLQASLQLGYPDFIKALAEQFACVICYDPAKDPCTMQCSHNACLKCLTKWFGMSDKHCCPLCQADVQGNEVKVNEKLDQALNALMPGYNPKGPPPRPFFLVKK